MGADGRQQRISEGGRRR
uniref:Uncharacterized protein n=1 Tax=Arundo donax TaxID=35708 RepID=A0A0A9B1E6_ARUDO